MGKDNKKVTNTTSTTTKPALDSTETTEYFVIDPKTGNKVFTPNFQRKVTQERVVGPDAQTLGLFNEHIAPTIAKKHGVTVNEKGEVVLDTPLSKFMGYDVEAERKRREKEKELNEFKRKEANWYNGISVLMDIAGAAAGANVQKRTPTDVAAQAVAANEALRKEGLAEDAAIEQVKQKKAYDYWSDMAKQISELNSKVREEYTEKPQSQKTKHTPEVKSTTTSTSTTTGGKNSSNTNGTKKEYSIAVNTNGTKKIEKVNLTQDDYNKIGDLLAAHYQNIITTPSTVSLSEPTEPNRWASEEKKAKYQEDKAAYDAAVAQDEMHKALADELRSYHKSNDTNGYTWDTDRMLANGVLYNLPQNIKDYITEASGGKITFGTPVKMDNGLMRETVIIQNDDNGWGNIDDNNYDD